MPNRSITLHTLQYSKADLDAVPEDDRLFFLMGTGLANELQMLNKLLVVIVETDPIDAHRIVNQANSAYGMLVVRILAGRLWEGWKILSGFSKKLKVDYEPHMGDEARAALRDLRTYFNSGKKNRPLLLDVRNHVAFHSLRETVKLAYDGLPSDVELGDYLSPSYGNTLYYSSELLHYEALKHLAGTSDHEEALRLMRKDTLTQTSNFNTAIYSFAAVFCERYLKDALAKLSHETDTFEVRAFEDLKLSFFSHLPIRRGDTAKSERLRRSRSALRAGVAASGLSRQS